MKKRTNDFLSAAAFVLSFVIIIVGLLFPIVMVENKQEGLLGKSGSYNAADRAPLSVVPDSAEKEEAKENEAEVNSHGKDNIKYICAKLKVWELSADKHIREPYSYELDMYTAGELAEEGLRELMYFGALPTFELDKSFYFSSLKLSSNYIETFGAQEIEEKYKSVEIDGIALPYDLGRWDMLLANDNGEFVSLETDAETGKIISIYLHIQGEAYEFSPGTALVIFAKHHELLDNFVNINYDVDNTCLVCGEVTLKCSVAAEKGGTDIRLDIITTENYKDGTDE